MRVALEEKRIGGILWRFLPFWMFLVFFKFGGGLHYSLLSPLGEQVLPLWSVGVLMGVSSVGQLLLDVPAGHILDRYGYKKFLLITTFIFLFAALCFVFGFSTGTYIASIAISTFGWLFFGPGVNAYILSHAPRESAGRFISLRDVFGSIGIVLSSAVLPFVLFFSPQLIGILLFGLLGIALVMLWCSPKDHESVHAEIKIATQHHYIKRHSLHATFGAVKKLNPASGMLLLLDLTGSIFYGVVWFVVPLVIAHQAHAGLMSIGLGTFDLSIVILGFLLGNLADRANKRALVFFGLLIFALSGMLIGFNLTWMFIILGFLATSGDEMAGISLWSWLHSLDKDHARDGTISGVINLSQDLGWSIGPIVAGLLFGIIGPSWTILFSAIPIFIVWVIYQVVMHLNPVHLIASHLLPPKPHRARHRT